MNANLRVRGGVDPDAVVAGDLVGVTVSEPVGAILGAGGVVLSVLAESNGLLKVAMRGVGHRVFQEATLTRENVLKLADLLIKAVERQP